MPFLVMDFVEGVSLAQHIESKGPMEPRDAAELIRKLALALEYAHACSILHRDVKPANVLLTQEGEPLLTDFGLSKDVDGDTSHLSKSGMFMGTPGYWPPEQARGELERIGPLSDVYALGATLYATLTGVPPIQANTLMEIIGATLDRPPTPPSELRPGLDKGLEAICLRCLEKEPEHRFESAEALGLALETWLREGAGPSRRRDRARALAWSVCLFVGGGLLASRGYSGGLSAAEAAARQPTREGWLMRGQALEREGDLDGAIAAYTHALERDPSYGAAFFYRGVARQERDETSGAQEDLSRAIDLAPAHALAWERRGDTRYALGNMEGAAEDYTRALQLRPGSVFARCNLGMARSSRGEHEAGLQEIGRAIALEPRHAGLRMCFGLVLARLERHQEALDAYDLAIELNSRYPDLYINRSDSRLALGDYTGAKQDLERAFDLIPDGDPRAAGVTQRLAKVEARLGE